MPRNPSVSLISNPERFLTSFGMTTKKTFSANCFNYLTAQLLVGDVFRLPRRCTA